MGGWSTKVAWAGWAAGSAVGSKLWVLHLLAGDPRGSWDLSGLFQHLQVRHRIRASSPPAPAPGCPGSTLRGAGAAPVGLGVQKSLIIDPTGLSQVGSIALGSVSPEQQEKAGELSAGRGCVSL